MGLFLHETGGVKAHNCSFLLNTKAFGFLWNDGKSQEYKYNACIFIVLPNLDKVACFFATDSW